MLVSAQIDQIEDIGDSLPAATDTVDGVAVTHIGSTTVLPANGYLLITNGDSTETVLPILDSTKAVATQWTVMPVLEEVFFGHAGGVTTTV